MLFIVHDQKSVPDELKAFKKQIERFFHKDSLSQVKLVPNNGPSNMPCWYVSMYR